MTDLGSAIYLIEQAAGVNPRRLPNGKMQTKTVRRAEWLTTDPRYYQIAVLFSLLIYGVGWLSFDVGAGEIAVLLGTVLIAQFLWRKIFRPRRSTHAARSSPASRFACRCAPTVPRC
jgi:hypothetical protein